MTVRHNTPEFERLMLIAQGHAAFQLLWAGVQLGVFDALSTQPDLDLEQLAEQAGVDHQPMRIVLVGLTALGLLETRDNRYRNPALVEEMLVSSKPGSLVPILGWQHHICYPGNFDFVDAVRQHTNVGLRHFSGPGDTLYQRLTSDKKLEKVFQDAMSALSGQANKAFVKSVDLSSVSRLVDVGGGDGTNVINIASEYPHLHLTVFDSASVCEIAQRNIAERGLEERIDTYPGDLFTTPFPPGVDAILYSHMFTIWSPEENVQILKKTYAALPVGGRAIIFNMMGNSDDSGPMSTALGSVYFQAVATGKGMLYPWGDYEDWLRAAGFASIDRVEGLPLDHGVFVAGK